MHGLEYKHEHGRLGYNQMVVTWVWKVVILLVGDPFSAKINILIKWLDLVPVQNSLTMWLLIPLVQLLSSGQYYKILLELEIPETSANQEVGVFMVNLTFHSTDGRYLSSSARPVSELLWCGMLDYVYRDAFIASLLVAPWHYFYPNLYLL